MVYERRRAAIFLCALLIYLSRQQYIEMCVLNEFFLFEKDKTSYDYNNT